MTTNSRSNRQQAEAGELSDAEKRDLSKLITDGKSLPEKYRFLLFQDKREVELVWNGKTREVCAAVLPFHAGAHRRAAPRDWPRAGGAVRHPRPAAQGVDE